jgi:hypothetical protein
MKSNSTSLDSRINLNKSSDTKKIAILPELATIHLGAPQDALERSHANNYIVFPMIRENLEFNSHFGSSPLAEDLMNSTFEELKRNGGEETPPHELTPLPSTPKYEFLNQTVNYRVIINSTLSSAEEDTLMNVLKNHWIVFGCFKGVIPSISTHLYYL